MKQEVEAKCAVEDIRAVEARVQTMGTLVVPWEFEANVLWDFPHAPLGKAGRLLRLRHSGAGAVLTYKEPVPGARAGIKTMAETETSVADPAAMSCMLDRLGLTPVWRYEKFRSVWRVPTASGPAGVCLDIVPCGQFVEVEAEAAAIAEVFSALHLTWGAEASRTYRDLFVDALAAQGLPSDTPMIFSLEAKEAWARALGVDLPPGDPFCLRDCGKNGCVTEEDDG
jgi:adenylate cyclase class 2